MDGSPMRAAARGLVVGAMAAAIAAGRGRVARAEPEESAPRAAADGKPMDRAASERFNRGSTHYNLGEYDQAIAEFKEAYRIEPRLMFLWSIAQAQRLKGDCAGAIRSYEAFLRSGPSQAGAERARAQIAVCRAALAKSSAATRAAAAPPNANANVDSDVDSDVDVDVDVDVDATNAAPAPPERRWWQDRPGHLLWWTGVAAGAGGAALLITGNYRVSDAPGRATYGAYLEARDGGRTLQQAGAAVLGVGGALACAGLIRFIYAGTTTGRRGHATPDTTTITATVGAGAAGLAIHGAF